VKIYIHCDMEGTSGIWRREQVDSSLPQYAQGRALLMADVDAAVAGAFDGGADEVVVCDTHGGGALLIEQMDRRRLQGRRRLAAALRRKGPPAPSSPTYAMAGTLSAFSTISSEFGEWFECKINSTPYGEIGQGSAYAEALRRA
jgi:hypothetical protein